jgi:small subunit ribosomal protein S16
MTRSLKGTVQMAVKIRLSRHGSKKSPIYFIIATDSNSCRDGDFLEKLGQYQPKAAKPSDKLTVNREAIQAWIAKGAQPTRTVGQLLKIK